MRDSQLLVAAGEGQSSLNIWPVDSADPANNRQLSHGETKEWLPVLSRDRRTLVYSRAKLDADGDLDYELWTAGAADGADARPLFGDNVPRECEQSAGRPAWLPTGGLILRCFDEADEARLLRVDTDGDVREVYEVATESFGDPTVSRDGRAVVMWGSADADAEGGSLYWLDVESGDVRPLLSSGYQRYSDPVFSSEGNALAFRDNTRGVSGFDVVVAPYADGTLGERRPLSSEPGRDQDPAFSPDGQQVVYGHMPPGSEGSTQRLYVVSTDGSGVPPALLAVGELVPDFASVPAWSPR